MTESAEAKFIPLEIETVPKQEAPRTLESVPENAVENEAVLMQQARRELEGTISQAEIIQEIYKQLYATELAKTQSSETYTSDVNVRMEGLKRDAAKNAEYIAALHAMAQEFDKAEWSQLIEAAKASGPDLTNQKWEEREHESREYVAGRDFADARDAAKKTEDKAA